MRKILFGCMFLLNIPAVFSQDYKLGPKDSLDLVEAWKPFQKAMLELDTEKVRALSLKKLDCLPCSQGDILAEKEPYFPVDTFFNCMRAFRQDKRLTSILQKEPTGVMVLEHEGKPGNYKLKRKEKFRVYSVRYVIYKPGEFAKGHEGAAVFFDFVKINGRFVFYGYWTNP